MSKLEKDSVSSTVQDITTKILQELKYDNESKLYNVQHTLKEGLKQNAHSLSNLERQIADLKDERQINDMNAGFNRTASFKFDDNNYRNSGNGNNYNNESLINQLNGSGSKNNNMNIRGRDDYASFNQRLDSENSNLSKDKKTINKDQQKKIDSLKKLLNHQEISHTEYMLKM